MIKLRQELIRPADGHTITADFVKYQLQAAVELEHSTIPPYLTAYYSVKPEGNQEAAEIVRSVVIEEMLHMTLACNLLNAIGGAPSIDRPDFIPTYPGPLPGGINSGLTVKLEALSKDVLKNVFMEIEEPEDPLEFPTAHVMLAEMPVQEFATIGAFYKAVELNLTHLVDEFGEAAVFCGDPKKQVTSFGPECVAVVDLDTAKQAIETIVEQGEGNQASPVDEQGELAHFYKFAELYHGRRLEKVPNSSHLPPDKQWAYTGAPIEISTADVFPITENAKPSDFPEGSIARVKANQFSYSYTSLLKALHITFNGNPGHLDASIGLMYSLRLQAQDLVAIDLGNGKNAAPTFTYQPVLK